MYLEYLKYVLRHKYYVFKFGLGVKVGLWQLLIHDWSKFLPVEFISYAKYFHGDQQNNSVEAAFNRAWLHHIHYNPHHWQHWLLRGKPIPIPEKYVREMVADWLGAGYAINGYNNLKEWYNKTILDRVLHDSTLNILQKVLGEIGYTFNSRGEII